MFHSDIFNHLVVPILRRNQLKAQQEFNDNKICVIAVIGTSLPNHSGFKRAFRLAIDTFGSLKLFEEEEEGKREEPVVLPPPPSDKKGEEDTPDQVGPGTNQEENGEQGTQPQPDEDKGPILSSVDEIEEKLEVTINEEGGGKSGEEGPSSDGNNPAAAVPEEPPPEGKDGDGDGSGNNNEDKFRIADEGYLKDCCYLDGFYNVTNNVLFLHLSGADDPQQLLQAAYELHRSIKKTGPVSIWSSLRSTYCRYLLLLFFVSHAVLLSEFRNTFNTSYIQLFRILDAVRLVLKPDLSKALEKVGILNKDWVHHGRMCSPRLLFLFEIDGNDFPPPKETDDLCLYGGLEKKIGDLEEEIYHIFRKCRIITNISANSLFALPAEDHFVFLFDRSAQNLDFVDLPIKKTYLQMVSSVCSSAIANMQSATIKPVPVGYRSTSGTSMKQAFRTQPFSTNYCDMLDKFRKFVFLHTELVLGGGFDDDSKRVSEHKHFFVVPTLGEWKVAFQVTFEALLGQQTKAPKLQEGLHQLRRYMNVDSEYLNNQCSAAFPKIYAIYQRGLPEYYTEQMHRIRLTHAMNAYMTVARGTGVVPWLNKLNEKCEQYWRKGRQQCEVLSLFGHPCVHPLHCIPAEDNLEIYPPMQLDDKYPEMKHMAGAKIISYCNCGRRQGYRDEPFTICEANFGFYQRIGKECCDELEHYSFPIFKPSDDSLSLSIVEMLNILKAKSVRYNGEADQGETDESLMMDPDLRQDELDLGDSGSSTDSQELNIVNDVKEEIELMDEETNEKTPETDAATDGPPVSEYLPGMIHSKTPQGLLPKFSSWSLVKLGLSSLYNHSSGISPRTGGSGFLAGTGYLLPWDVFVKAEAGVSKPVPRVIRGRRASSKPKPISDEFSVKVFYGLEYECPRGHRFIANDVDKVVNFDLGNSGLKQAATNVANSDMPLFYKCPCKESRDGRIMIAQLMRIHIVTPKAPVHCKISPRVHPAPSSSCPIFFPETQDPIKLSTSSYWVLRLPYCYVGELHIYGLPPDPSKLNPSHAKLYQGFLTVQAMTQAETKVWEKNNL